MNGQSIYFIQQLVIQLPMLLATGVGIVLLSSRRRSSGGSRALAIAGCAVAFVATMAGLAWSAAYPQLWNLDRVTIEYMSTVMTGVTLVLSVLHAAGVGLLIVALLVDRRDGSRSEPTWQSAG